MPISNPYIKSENNGSVVVNPYLKKKKPTTASVATPRASLVTPQAKKQPVLSRAPPPTTTTTTPSVVRAKGHPIPVTPKAVVVPTVVPSAQPSSVAVVPASSATTGATDSTTQTVIPNSSTKKQPLTLKQKLKLEIASLKKQRQLLQWQKEAKERAAVMAREKAQKEAARQAYLQQQAALKQAKEAERQAKLAAQEQQRQARLLQLQQEQEEKRKLEQQRMEQAQLDYQKALLHYQQEASSYPFRYAQWVQQRQQWMAGFALQRAAAVTNRPSPILPAPAGYGSGAVLMPTTTMTPYPPPPQVQSHPDHHMMDAFRCMPMQLLMPPLPPVVPQPPKLLTKSTSTFGSSGSNNNNNKAGTKRIYQRQQPPSTLSKAILEGPSPYATTYELLSQKVILIRSPPDQPSFGVNLKAETTSRLVEPPTQMLLPSKSTTTAIISSNDKDKENLVVEKQPMTVSTNEPIQNDQSVLQTTNGTAERAEDGSTVPLPTPVDSGIKKEEGIKKEVEEDPSSCTKDTHLPDAPLADTITSTPASITTTTTTSATPITASGGTVIPPPPPPKPTRPRRRRVHFTVMVVSDAIKQNQRWTDRRRVVMIPNSVEVQPEESVQADASPVVPKETTEVQSNETIPTDTNTFQKEAHETTTVEPIQTDTMTNETSDMDICTKEGNTEDSIAIETNMVLLEPEVKGTDDEDIKTDSNTKQVSSIKICTEGVNTNVKTDVDDGDAATSGPLTTVQENEEPILLQPGDIILKIGGVDVAGMTFAQACRVFHEKSVEVKIAKENGEMATEIRVELVVARAKKIAITPAVKIPVKIEAKTPAPVSTAPRPLLQSGMLVGTKSSAHFSFPELAVLADCIIQAIHDHSTNRLLGQQLSRSLLEKNTSIFRKVDGLKECILNPRSLDMIMDQWNQMCLGIRANLADRARMAWTQQVNLEDGREEGSNVRGVAPLFTSDAERTALRQLPRPAKGCRCQRRDHEYLHDVRCTLYRDICRMIPADELKELQFNSEQGGIKPKASGDKDLTTVEAAFKDRMIKMLNVAEMEEAEARFVAKMERIQVQQMHKAIFAPNLATMVLSTIMELQKEFPSDNIKSNNSDLEDDVEDEHLTLAGKRKQGSNLSSSPTKKKFKVKGVEHLSFKYLVRMVQLIGNTWGHVYREPSHEDYAWRWELYHGHNSDGAQWEATSKNPRTPNTLCFDSVRHVMDVVATKSNSNLSKASQAIADLEDIIQSELIKQQAATADKVPAPPLPTTVGSGDVQPMETDPTTPASSEPSTASSLKAYRMDIHSETVEQLCLAAYLLSPVSTGLYDELLALVKTGVIDISPSGIPALAEDWVTKVDYVVLQDMEDHWKNDAMNRYCIWPAMKEMLQCEWIYEDDSWALSSDPDDVIYNVPELEEWRTFFQGQIEAQTNLSEGIGRFGL